jgi:iron complex transport system substrate-binding protein
VLLDGKLGAIPDVVRRLGAALHREARAEELARLAEATLATTERANGEGPRLVYVHGPDGAEVMAPGGSNSELPAVLGWTILAPPGQGGAFRKASVQDIAALDPDVILFASPAMREKVATDPAWRGLRAVRGHHAWIAPSLPFGWVEGPPSINRLLGLAWLGSGSPSDGAIPYAAAFHAMVYGRAMTPEQIAALRRDLRPIEP